VMVDITCIVSDGIIWNRDQFLIDLTIAMRSNQNIELNLNQEGVDIECIGIPTILQDISNITDYDLSKLTVITFNCLQKNDFKFNIMILSPVHHIFKTLTVDNHKYQTDKIIKKHFGCFIGRSNAPRLWLSCLFYTRYQDKTIQTFHYDPLHDFHRNNLGLEDLLSNYNQRDIRDIANFLIECPMTLPGEIVSYPIYQHESQHTDLRSMYKDFFVEIVCETFFSGQTFNPTEKIWRCIAMKTPFIVQGPKYFLKNLKKMKFRTFDSYWDEGYDHDTGRVRLDNIANTLEFIASKSCQEIQELYQKMIPDLEHNFELLNSITKHDFLQLCYDQ